MRKRGPVNPASALHPFRWRNRLLRRLPTGAQLRKIYMTDKLSKGDQPSFDPSQFRLQPDGTFRISIRGMAAMAGVDDAALGRSLKSAAAENPLPCARSLLSQGFCPAAVSTWGETGGIPEDAAPFILEHYGINAASPSQRARAALLAFSRVGINAYLKERLGISTQLQSPGEAPQQLKPQDALDVIERSYDLLERFGVADDRDRIQFGDMVRSVAARGSGGLLLPPDPGSQELTISDAWLEITGQRLPRDQGIRLGRLVASMYRNEFQKDPPTRTQWVDGAPRQVKSYVRRWLVKALSMVQGGAKRDGLD